MAKVILSVSIASVAFLIACLALFRPLQAALDIKKLRRAFEALEEEFEDQRDHVRTALGRISRLKRSTIEAGHVAPPDGEESEAPALPPSSGAFRLTQRQQEIQNKILAKRKGQVQ